MDLSRRAVLGAVAALGLAHGRAEAAAPATGPAAADGPLPPIRPLTRGPRFHWFGYYDKLEFDPTGRYVLANEVGFEHRSPTAADSIAVGMIDTAEGNRWVELGRSSAWNWQQGCMLQFLPGSPSEVIYNDRQGDAADPKARFVAHIVDVRTGRRRTIGSPVYCVSPDGSWGLACDFRRLNDVRPGYGYAGIGDPRRDQAAPDDSGIWRVDLATGAARLLFSLADVLKIPNPPVRLPAGHPGLPDPQDRSAKHWFNHLLVSPDGSRFIFLHRWRTPEMKGSFHTRLFTASADGRDLFVLDPYGRTSHFIWRDAGHVAAWAWHPSKGEKFYLYADRTDRVEAIGPEVMTANGHLSYLPAPRGHWIVNDTYPDRQRLQHPYLYDTRTGRRRALGHFLSPRPYAGEWRCDTHPRVSPDGRKVAIDSPHGGDGRQVYLIDVSGIVG